MAGSKNHVSIVAVVLCALALVLVLRPCTTPVDQAVPSAKGGDAGESLDEGDGANQPEWSAPVGLDGGSRRVSASEPDSSPSAAAAATSLCSLGGSLEPVPPLLRPERWTAHLEACDALGTWRDAERIERGPDDATFLFTGLEPGIYAVRAEAEGLRCGRHEVLLGVGGHHVHVVLEVGRPAHLVGAILLADGSGVAGQLVSLDRANGTEARLEVRTDPVGRFRFDELLEGAWHLSIGARDAPLVPTELVVVPSSGAVLPDRVLADVIELRLRVVDPEGRGVPGIRLRGAGSNGGAIDVVTDGAGRARGFVARAGRFRVRGEAPGFCAVFAAFDVPIDLVWTSGEYVIALEPN